MLTQRALLLGAVALCFYLVAVVNTLQSYYYILVWLALGLLAASLGIALLSLTGTSCTLREGRARGYARTDNDINEVPPFWEVVLKNVGSLNKTGLVLECQLLLDSSPQTRGKTKGSSVQARFLIEALPAGETMTSPLLLDFLPRGIYTLQSARIIGSDVLGLFRASKRLALPDAPIRVTVAPAIVPLLMRREMARGASDRDGARATARLGTGDDLRGVRTYVQGDDWRHVHWATTARTGELVVREFERAGRDSVLVVWDGALGISSGREVGTRIEEELSVVASLLVSINATRTSVDVVLLGSECLYMRANGDEGLLSNEAVDALARARAERTRPLRECLAKEREGQPKSGQVLFVSSSLESELVESVTICVLNGESPVVALLESARHTNAPRFLKNVRGQTAPTSIERQQKALETAGARVVRVPLVESGRSLLSLEKELLQLVEAV